MKRREPGVLGSPRSPERCCGAATSEHGLRGAAATMTNRISAEVKGKPQFSNCAQELTRDLFHRELYDRRSAWISLLSKSGEDGEPCGQALADLEALSAEWGWSETRVLSFLEELAQWDLIEFLTSAEDCPSQFVIHLKQGGGVL
jgi:hypothetical protein